MGVTPSVDLNHLNSNYSQHFGILFSLNDRFRLVLAPREVVHATRVALSTYFEIQDEQNEQSGFVEFKLRGSPFASSSKHKDISMKHLMCALLREYYALGWHYKCASELKRRGGGSDALIFERAASPLLTQVLCLSLNNTDKIRVMSPSNESIVSTVRNTIMSQWPHGIQKEDACYNCDEFKLNGNPWVDGTATRDSVRLVSTLIESLHRQGWMMIGAIKTSKKPYARNALYFRYDASSQRQHGRFFTLSLNGNNRIRLHNATQEAVMTVKLAIQQYWSKGVKREMFKKETYDFIVEGTPWCANSTETVDSRRLLGGILTALRQSNWNVYGTCKITAMRSLKSEFIFHQTAATPSQRTTRTTCISLNEWSKLRVIDGDQSMVNTVRNAINIGWPNGIANEGVYGQSWQFILNGCPFSENPIENPIYTLVMMMLIMSNLENQHGLRFLCSADVSGKYHSAKNNSYSIDLSSWFFI